MPGILFTLLRQLLVIEITIFLATNFMEAMRDELKINQANIYAYINKYSYAIESCSYVQ